MGYEESNLVCVIRPVHPKPSLQTSYCSILHKHLKAPYCSSLSEFQSCGWLLETWVRATTTRARFPTCWLCHCPVLSMVNVGGVDPGNQILPGFTNARQCCASRLFSDFSLIACHSLNFYFSSAFHCFTHHYFVFLLVFSLSSHVFILSFKWPRIGLGLLVHVLSDTHFQVLNTMMKVSWCLTSCCLTTHQRFTKHTLKKAELCWMHTYQRRH